MSKYMLNSIKDDYIAFVGWDSSLNTYFAQVIRSIDIDNKEYNPIIVWVGFKNAEIFNSEDLIPYIKDYVEIPDDILQKLKNDYLKESIRDINLQEV